MSDSDFQNLQAPQEFDALETIQLGAIRNLSDSVDWRSTSYLNGVQDQLTGCSSDYVFAAAMTMETISAIALNTTAKVTAMSQQYVLDCDFSNQGCKGGWATKTFKFVANKGYAGPDKYAAYTGVSRKCYNPISTDIKRIPKLKAKQLLMINTYELKCILSDQPAIVAVNAPDCFRAYSSGVLSQFDCDCTSESYIESSVNAIMAVVGYGVLKPDAKEALYCDGYYILRPAWGTNWGEQGDIRLCINKNRHDDVIGTCNVHIYPHLPDNGILKPITY